jgi:hypothetical protein
LEAQAAQSVADWQLHVSLPKVYFTSVLPAVPHV